VWQLEPVSGIVQPLAQELSVSSQCDCLEARVLNTFPDVIVDFRDSRHVDLENLSAIWSSNTKVLILRGSPATHD
jgi:hypothetical protein